ncbi:MAG TPA: hypothetical protein EYQ00_00750 [Dehalococcoidia bacterium]|jgi:aminomethyltransferase|nr:hypothetical protein [Dehalococcoidia bacterium]
MTEESAKKQIIPIIPTIGGVERTNVLPLVHLHMKANWHPAPVHSFTLPLWYQGTYDEQRSARSGTVISDRSYLGRFYVTGENAEQVLDRVFTSDPYKLAIGQISRTVACNEDGTVFDIAIWCRLDAGRWLIISGPRTQTSLLKRVEQCAETYSDVLVRDRLEESVLLSVSGPDVSDSLVTALGPTIPKSIPLNEGHEILLGGYRALVANYSETGEMGYLIICSPEVGEHIWQQLLSVGTEPIGLAASDALRLEANFLEAPAEIPHPATPFHAGLAQLVDLEDGENTRRTFEGSAQLEKDLKEFPTTRSIKAFKLLDKGLAKKGDTVQLYDGTVISACVAAFYSAALGASLAFAYIPRKHLNDSLYIDTDSSRSSTEPIRPEELLAKIKGRP